MAATETTDRKSTNKKLDEAVRKKTVRKVTDAIVFRFRHIRTKRRFAFNVINASNEQEEAMKKRKGKKIGKRGKRKKEREKGERIKNDMSKMCIHVEGDRSDHQAIAAYEAKAEHRVERRRTESCKK